MHLTPLMQQYHAIKNRYSDALVLFQVGDFFEFFHEDAKKAAPFLGIALTKRGKSEGEPIPLCGVPCHALDHYLLKLVRGGFCVVLCEQQGAVEQGKLVERKVTQVFTPGTLTDEKLLDSRSSSLYAVCMVQEGILALIIGEVLTGRCILATMSCLNQGMWESELARWAPRELVILEQPDHDWLAEYGKQQGYSVCRLQKDAMQNVHPWFEAQVEDSVRLLVQRSRLLTDIVTLWYGYLARMAPDALSHVRSFCLYQPEEYMLMDAHTQRTLELVSSLDDGSRKGTLWSTLDHSVTAMGSRLLKQWIVRPLLHAPTLAERQGWVVFFVEHIAIRSYLRALLKEIGDFERVVGRIAIGRASFSDYRTVREMATSLLDMARFSADRWMQQVCAHTIQHIDDIQVMVNILQKALHSDPTRDWLIQAGYHAELDRLRDLGCSGERALLALEQDERSQTGIASLKIRFNGAHGYAFEVTKTHRESVPERYKLVQSLVNRDRFSTVELRQLEYELQHAQAQARILEQELFAQVVESVRGHKSWLLDVAQELATLDVLVGLAEVAVQNRYVQPIFVTEKRLFLQHARHAVVEQALHEGGTPFVTNTIHLNQQESTWIITGPNMGGKSTFLRQTALSVIMAQIGSFVPATQATLSLCDRIFTRIGSGDHVAGGKSTFFVEMEEVARICHEATERSLVVLDEVGRGTSTHDGMVIAQAVLEYLHQARKPWILFATHYHEVATYLRNVLGIGVHHVASTLTQKGELVLLHTLQPGIAQSSFGISVARKAGLPNIVITRAQELLADRHI